jgi:uncharacterized protein (DUF58 family)
VTSARAAGYALAAGSAARQPLTWRAAPRLGRLALVAVAAMAAAVLARQAGLLLLAAPALAVLAAARGGRPPEAAVTVTTSVSRCFEGEAVEITVTVAAPVDEIAFRFEPEGTMVLASGEAAQAVVRPGGDGAQAVWVARPRAWGRRLPGVVSVRLRSGGLWQAALELHPPLLEVFPHPPQARVTLLPEELLRRIGDHAARVPGPGIEFAGIRAYQPGDRLRDLNWPVSSRTGRPHVNQRAALRAADLVVMVDAFSDVGPPGDSTLDIAVRGAAGLVTAYLRSGDRVGAVVLGGVLRWLGPAPSQRQFFRIVEMAFGARFHSEVTPDLDRVPRTALPPRSLIVLFSPLLDSRAVSAITDLRQRGASVVVVDVLRHEPPPSPGSRASLLAVRLWRLDRRALRASLGSLGVPVLRWDSETGLDGALVPLRGRPLSAVRP